VFLANLSLVLHLYLSTCFVILGVLYPCGGFEWDGIACRSCSLRLERSGRLERDGMGRAPHIMASVRRFGVSGEGSARYATAKRLLVGGESNLGKYGRGRAVLPRALSTLWRSGDRNSGSSIQ